VHISLRFCVVPAPLLSACQFSWKLAFSGLATLALALLPAGAIADTVVLTNGDHLTGSVTQLDGGKLTVHTDYAGDIVIAFDKVSSVKVDKPVVLSLKVTPPPGQKKSNKGLDIRRRIHSYHNCRHSAGSRRRNCERAYCRLAAGL